MCSNMNYALTVLQQCAYARVLCEVQRLRAENFQQPMSFQDLTQAVSRLKTCTDRWASVQQALDPAYFPALRVARSLRLQEMLGSAPARLRGWSDGTPLSRMPASHLLEWVAFDLERLELAELEDAMTPEEAAMYAAALDEPRV
jgi:hypothetical protein